MVLIALDGTLRLYLIFNMVIALQIDLIILTVHSGHTKMG
jgi:hypothetical protein